MTERYHEGQRALQDHFDTRRLADRLGEVTGDSFSPEFVRFIEARDMVFMASADATGSPECSYKGGEPGFVRVLDEHTLSLPWYDGNGMFRTLGNLTVNPSVGLLFIDFESGTRLRVNGTATLDLDGPLVDSYPGAHAVVRIRATAIFPNCTRYVHEYHPATRSPFVPDGQGAPPVPDWKRDPWFEGTLPEHDPAHRADHPSAPATPRF